uniref:Uncharacterized protein n=1 Tax=Anguilla anguilla TaxID=7936 RepID=A0A0E9RBG5_ANGAN
MVCGRGRDFSVILVTWEGCSPSNEQNKIQHFSEIIC